MNFVFAKIMSAQTWNKFWKRGFVKKIKNGSPVAQIKLSMFVQVSYGQTIYFYRQSDGKKKGGSLFDASK